MNRKKLSENWRAWTAVTFFYVVQPAIYWSYISSGDRETEHRVVPQRIESPQKIDIPEGRKYEGKELSLDAFDLRLHPFNPLRIKNA